MSENNPEQKITSERKPDNIIKSYHDGTTYTIREFAVGKEPVVDIIARRVIRDLEPNFSMK